MMIKTTDDKKGIGKIKGSFVYFKLDEDGDATNMPVVANVMNGCSIVYCGLIDIEDNELCLNNTYRDILYSDKGDDVFVLEKSDLKNLIDSLNRVYEEME